MDILLILKLDGDTSANISAFESIIRIMKEEGIGYGAINHPVDRDPVCGYVGVIGDVCPKSGRKTGESVSVEKLKKMGAKAKKALPENVLKRAENDTNNLIN